MRVLSITAQKPTSTGSGVYLTEVVRSLNKLGHENAVLFGKSKEDDKFSIEDEVEKVIAITFDGADVSFKIAGMSDNMPYPSTRYCDFSDSMTLEFTRAYFKKISQAFIEFRPDLIICHHLYLATAIAVHVNETLLHPAKIVAISHGTEIRQMQKHQLCASYIKRAVQNLDQIYVLHEDQIEQVRDVYGAELSKIDVIGTGFNADVFNAKSADLTNREPHSIIYAGKICKQKGVPELILAAASLNEKLGDVKLTLAGGHSNEAEYRKIMALIDKNRERVEIDVTGAVSQAELARLYRSSQVFCLPSFFEGLPLVTLEAIACGCSAVMTDLPGVRPWYLKNAKRAPLIFVKPPKMNNVDVPVLSDLPAFQANLKNALLEATKIKANPSSVENLSWLSLSNRLVEKISKI